MAEEVESGASVHLPHDSLGAGVDAFGTAVVVAQSEPFRVQWRLDSVKGLSHGTSLFLSL